MWLQPDSYLYAKWNFSWAIRRSWSAIELTQVTPTPLPPPTGDYNKNGTVDAADYVLWLKTFDDETPAANRPADGNHDGYVDDYDYAIWRENFGNEGSPVTGATLAQVPEPTTAGLGAVGIFLFAIGRNCCRRRIAA